MGPRGQPLVRHMIALGVQAAPQAYARMGDRATLEKLIDADPSVLRSDAVMMGAVDFKHHALARWLLSLGANVNARSHTGSRHTALHSAAWNGDLEMAKLLLAAGADITARDERFDGTPEDWAAKSIEVTNNPKCQEVADYLANRSG